MQKITMEQYLADRVDRQYDYFSKAATAAKLKYQTMKVIEIILASMVPFLSALMTPSSTEYMKIVVGILGVGITIISGALLLYKFSENWVNFRTTAEALKSEKFLFLTRSGPYKGKGANSFLIEKVEMILGEESQKWQSYVVAREDIDRGGPDDPTDAASSEDDTSTTTSESDLGSTTPVPPVNGEGA